jgi:hypothetical protein
MIRRWWLPRLGETLGVLLASRNKIVHVPDLVSAIESKP